MTTPEKLFVFVVEGEGISAFKAEAAALAIRHCIATRGTTDPSTDAPVQAYVREDVAAAREAAAEAKYKNRAAAEMAAQVEINAALHDYSDEITARICQMAEDLGLKSEPLEVGPDAAEVLSAIHDVLGERDALRRERDALAARVEKLRERLGRVVAMGPDEAPDSLADDAPDCDSFGSNEDAFMTGRSQGGQEAAWSSAREAACGLLEDEAAAGKGVG